MKRLLYTAVASFLLTAIWSLRRTTPNTETADHEALLRGLLRRFPFWAYGHRCLAELALETNSVSLAYASALAFEQLSRRRAHDRAIALALLGRCFLMRGECQRALDYFIAAKTLGLDTPLLAEDTAAAHILQGRYALADEILSHIPAHAISAAGKAALGFVKDKLTAQPSEATAPVHPIPEPKVS